MKMYLYKIENRSTNRGFAKAVNINLLTPLSEIYKTGQEVFLDLQDGKPEDYLPNNLIWPICSERMRDAIDKCRQPQDDYQWVNVTVLYQNQQLPYFALWFHTVPDVLDHSNTLLMVESQDYVRIPVFRAVAIGNRSVVIFEKYDNPRWYVSELVKRILINAGCTGIVFSRYEVSGELSMPKLPPLAKKANKIADTVDVLKLASLKLPNELQTYLRLRKNLKYKSSDCEPGRIVLKPLADLELSEVWVDSEESPLRNNDPHGGEEGYYVVPAVSLVHECEGYDPEFILLWLPDEGLFGTWDSDHWDLKVFPNTDWESIVSNPVPYINAQWDQDSKVSRYFIPWPRYEFKQGRPF
jgi:hypothetical protein